MGKKGIKMNATIFGQFLSLFEKVTDVSQSVADAADADKYAKSIHLLNEDVEKTYAVMRELIEKDDTMSTEEKLERLTKLAELEEQSKKTCDEAIQGNREHVAKIVTQVVTALLTGGISLAPSLFRALKSQGKELPLSCEIVGEISEDDV